MMRTQKWFTIVLVLIVGAGVLGALLDAAGIITAFEAGRATADAMIALIPIVPFVVLAVIAFLVYKFVR